MHVAQIGCGLMGSALASTLAQGGEVVAWNRTPSRARALVAANLRVADDVNDAVAGSELVVLSLSDYQAAREVLDTVADWSGTTLVNLITGAPHEAEEFDAWAAERDIPYLDGTILSYPAQIGTPDAVIAYAGPRALWERHAGRLTVLALRTCIEEACAAIIAGDFSTDQATLDVYAAATKTWSATLAAAGQHARYAQALDENMDTALAAGHGRMGFYAQYLSAWRDSAPPTRSA